MIFCHSGIPFWISGHIPEYEKNTRGNTLVLQEYEESEKYENERN